MSDQMFMLSSGLLLIAVGVAFIIKTRETGWNEVIRATILHPASKPGAYLKLLGFSLAALENFGKEPWKAYYGFLSNLGILIWAAGAFIPFYSSFLVRNPGEKDLLRQAGILTFVLLLADLLLIHDEFFPQVQPKDQLETLLAAQMATVYSLTMNLASRIDCLASLVILPRSWSLLELEIRYSGQEIRVEFNDVPKKTDERLTD